MTPFLQLACPKIPLRWLTEIESWNPPVEFIDLQAKGPFKFWRHTHRFSETDAGTSIVDMVAYALPFGPLGRLVTARAPTGHCKQPQKERTRRGLWSRQFPWRERAAVWDSLVDRRIRERRLDVIEKMAARHAGPAKLDLEDLMAPIIAFAQAMQDPIRAAAFENLPILELFKLSLTSASLLPKLQEAERIARGCKVLATLRPVLKVRASGRSGFINRRGQSHSLNSNRAQSAKTMSGRSGRELSLNL